MTLLERMKYKRCIQRIDEKGAATYGHKHYKRRERSVPLLYRIALNQKRTEAKKRALRSIKQYFIYRLRHRSPAIYLSKRISQGRKNKDKS